LRYVVGRPAMAALALRRHLPGELFERLYFGALLRSLTRSGGEGPGKVPHPARA
jgi:hypothetical protein